MHAGRRASDLARQPPHAGLSPPASSRQPIVDGPISEIHCRLHLAQSQPMSTGSIPELRVVSTAGNKDTNDGPPDQGIELQLTADTAYALTQARDVIGLDAAKRSDLVDE